MRPPSEGAGEDTRGCTGVVVCVFGWGVRRESIPLC